MSIERVRWLHVHMAAISFFKFCIWLCKYILKNIQVQFIPYPLCLSLTRIVVWYMCGRIILSVASITLQIFPYFYYLCAFYKCLFYWFNSWTIIKTARVSGFITISTSFLSAIIRLCSILYCMYEHTDRELSLGILIR